MTYKTKEAKAEYDRKRFRLKGPTYEMWRAAKKRARKFNVPFAITPNDIKIPDVCPVLGIKLSQGTGRVTETSPSLDRFYPERGYVINNIAVISQLANRMKQDRSTHEVGLLYSWMSKHE